MAGASRRCCALSPAGSSPAPARSRASRGLRVGHVEQDIPARFADTAFHDLVHQPCRPSRRQRRLARRCCARLARGSRATAPAPALAPEWRLARLAMLARIWVPSPICCCWTSRPTNSISPGSINWKTGQRPAARGAGVISSHDRAFLDATTNRTLFLRPERSQVFALPYTRARHDA